MNVQNKLKKFSLQAGQDEMIWLAVARFDLRASTCQAKRAISNTPIHNISFHPPRSSRLLRTCSELQHTGPSFHFAPHRSVSCLRSFASGSSASSLSTQGSCFPKKLFDPQWPRIAQRPASCFGVNSSSAADILRPAKRSPPIATSRDRFVMVDLDRRAAAAVTRVGIARKSMNSNGSGPNKGRIKRKKKL